MACRITRARMWSVRIMHEAKLWPSVSFVTLTYDDEHLPASGSLVKQDVQLFLKRLRKNLDRQFRYFLSGEYGEHKHRPHYHSVLFGVGSSDRKTLEQTWGKGHIHLGTVTHDSACYVASYTLKKLSGPSAARYERDGIIPEFCLMSRRPGIGSAYVEENKEFLKQNAFCVVKGNKTALPRYYADKVFPGDEKLILRALRGEFHEQQHEELMKRSGAEADYQVIDYQRGQRAQTDRDLKARAALRRRKL